MKNFAQDYEESIAKYYHIYPCSGDGEEITEDSITLNLDRTVYNDELVLKMVEILNTLSYGEENSNGMDEKIVI